MEFPSKTRPSVFFLNHSREARSSFFVLFCFSIIDKLQCLYLLPLLTEKRDWPSIPLLLNFRKVKHVEYLAKSLFLEDFSHDICIQKMFLHFNIQLNFKCTVSSLVLASNFSTYRGGALRRTLAATVNRNTGLNEIYQVLSTSKNTVYRIFGSD